MIAVPLILGLAMGMPRNITDRDPLVFRIFFLVIFVGAIRATILWFQTVRHGLKHAKEENRFAVVLGHLFLGIVMAYADYLSSRLDSKKAVNKKRQRTRSTIDRE